MEAQERNYAYLWDMLESAKLVVQFLQEVKYNDFIHSKLLQSAVARQLVIIGEAARRVTTEFQEEHPAIPWRSMIGLRNILVHEYGEVREDRVWLIATTRVPELIELIAPLIPPIEEA